MVKMPLSFSCAVRSPRGAEKVTGDRCYFVNGSEGMQLRWLSMGLLKPVTFLRNCNEA